MHRRPVRRGTQRKLTRIAAQMNRLDDQRRHVIERYVKGEVPAQDYIEASRALDATLETLTRAKAETVERTKAHGLRENVQASVRHFCATARARFDGCSDLDAKRQFLRDHIEAIIFSHGSVAIVGTIAEAQLPFRIEDQIDRAAVRLNSALKGSKAAFEARFKTQSLPVRSISAGGRVPLASR